MIFIVDFSESVKLFFSLKFSFTFVNFALVSEKHSFSLYIYIFFFLIIILCFICYFPFFNFVYSFCFFTFLEICDISMFSSILFHLCSFFPHIYTSFTHHGRSVLSSCTPIFFRFFFSPRILLPASNSTPTFPTPAYTSATPPQSCSGGVSRDKMHVHRCTCPSATRCERFATVDDRA